MFHKIFTIAEHQEIKPLILDDIEKFKNSSIYDSTTTISKTDWNVPFEVPRTYFNHLKPFINGEYLQYLRYLGGTGGIVRNIWFQQYYNTDAHTTHGHPGVNFSNIYYLELPNQSQRTEFYNPITKEFFSFDVKEGDLLTFPAYYPHRSPKNIGNDRKTVVVFNSCLDVFHKKTNIIQID